MELPKRKNNRLKGYDYSSCGAYFITVCAKDRENLFGSVGADIIRPQGLMQLSRYGEVIGTAINAIELHYKNVIVDKYCIMPNHIHLIIFLLSDSDGRMVSAPTISTIIGSMKRWTSKQIGESIWQRSFHDHVIRDEHDYEAIWDYIDTNPLMWEQDCFYVE